jgi:glycosyltransferase involved in cell wall biosynthesis
LKQPVISIITISLNAEKYIEQTIQSVLSQTYKYIEYIVVDGGSTDHTVEIVNKYKHQINHFISENDDGIADAMNKGVALATGDYVVFLNADYYFKNEHSLKRALKYLEKTTDIIACSIQFGEQPRISKPRGFNFWTNFKGLPHQGTICRTSLIKKFDGFDKRFHICMDYDFFLRVYRNGARLMKVPVILTVMRDTGISSRPDWKSLRDRFDEERKIHEKNCDSLFMNMLYHLYWSLYLPYRSVNFLMRETLGSLKK